MTAKKLRPIRHRLFRRFLSFLRFSKRFSTRQFRTLVASVAIFFVVSLSVLPPAWAGSNGRAGGSFGSYNRRQSPPISRTIRPPPQVNIRNIPSRRTRTRVLYAPPRLQNKRIYHQFHHETDGDGGVAVMTNPEGTTSYVRKVSTDPFSNSRYTPSDIILVSGVTAVVTNGVLKRRSDSKKYNDGIYPLGPGVSVWCMTACLNIPDVKDSTSVVRRLQNLAETISTETRQGLQLLLAETSLELLRQLDKGSVASVETRYDHYRPSDQAVTRAERQYNRISTKERSRFDTESWSNYNGNTVVNNSEEESLNEGSDFLDASAAKATSSFGLVQIHLIMEGNTMQPFGQRQMETKASFRDALVQLSGDLGAVENCVLAGEVLWSPQKPTEVITEEDVYTKYPTLWSVDYGSAM